MSRLYITTEELAELQNLAASWAREHDTRMAETGIGPLSHDYARLGGMLARIGGLRLDQRTPWASIAWEPADLMRGRQDESAGGHGYFATEAEAAAFLAQHVDAIRDASTVAGWEVIEELARMAGLHDEDDETADPRTARTREIGAG